jgi:hypothetical protein
LVKEPADSEVNVSTTSEGGTVGFATDVKPLFREKDRNSMESSFDLWSYDDVREAAPRILAKLEDGTMPCDGAWPEAQVELFRRWVEGGTPG